ncbi:MAG: tyrosine-type recombinase/integrase [Phycisphaerales bacterium]
MRQAEAVKSKVEDLLGSSITGDAPRRSTSDWVRAIDETLHERLARVGLVQPREAKTQVSLASAIELFGESRKDVKPQTRLVWKQAHDSLREYFGDDKPVDEIGEGDAEDFEQHLIGQGYAKATVRKRIGVAKMLWRWASRRGYVDRNVFADLKSATVATKHKYFVTQEEAAAVLDACPDVQWRLIFALARYGGLRVPSEICRLTWADIDWERRRMRVQCPKTQHHEGHEERIVPIFPELVPYLQDAFDAAEEGVDHVVTAPEARKTSSAYLRKRMHQIIRQAGLTPWARVFHNLRSSRQTELEQQFPPYAACKWIGNSQKVARDHYLQMTDDLMDRAAGVDEAMQNAVQKASEHTRTASKARKVNSPLSDDFDAIPDRSMSYVAPPGFEPGTCRL